MKKALFFSLLVLLPFILFGEIGSFPFVSEPFDIDIIQHPHMTRIDNPLSEHINTYYTFTNKERSYQVRYSFLKQTNVNDPAIRSKYGVAVMLLSLNLAGHEDARFTNFEDNDVKNEFNGDFGTTVFIPNPVSDYCEGFNFLMLNFYYKQNVGIVAQSILFNDLSIAQSRTFIDLMYSFRFRD